MSDKIYKKDYFGFIYIWWDKRRNKYYIGSHMGSIDDGYICSSKTMYDNYYQRIRRNQPNTFKRRILYYLSINDRNVLLTEEQRWINMIADEEIGTKYYNISKTVNQGDNVAGVKALWADPERSAIVKENMSKSWTEERGATHGEKISKKHKEGKYTYENSTISEAAREGYKRHVETGNAKHSKETKAKQKISAKQRANTPEYIEWITKNNPAKLIRGKKWYNNGIKQQRFNENEIPEGWQKGTLKKKKETV